MAKGLEKWKVFGGVKLVKATSEIQVATSLPTVI
jgi:hypothetical protein